MGRTACTEPQYLYKGAIYFTFTTNCVLIKIPNTYYIPNRKPKYNELSCVQHFLRNKVYSGKKNITCTNTEENLKEFSKEKCSGSHVEHDWNCWLFHIKGYRKLLPQYLYPLRLDLM